MLLVYRRASFETLAAVIVAVYSRFCFYPAQPRLPFVQVRCARITVPGHLRITSGQGGAARSVAATIVRAVTGIRSIQCCRCRSCIRPDCFIHSKRLEWDLHTRFSHFCQSCQIGESVPRVIAANTSDVQPESVPLLWSCCRPAKV